MGRPINEFKNFRYAGIDMFDLNNGNGVGATLFVQGCSHHCEGCHNQSTWKKSGGMKFTKSEFDTLFDTLSHKAVTRLTISGGEPFDNLDFTEFIVKRFREQFPEKKLWIYTGYTYEEILLDDRIYNILETCDILVDGEFVQDLKDLSLAFRGSSNQRIIDVKESLKQNKTILWKVRNS